jgi:hypothetical protein
LFSTEIHQHLRAGLVSFDCRKDQQVLQVPVFASEAVVRSVAAQSLAGAMGQVVQVLPAMPAMATKGTEQLGTVLKSELWSTIFSNSSISSVGRSAPGAVAVPLSIGTW